MSGTDRRYGLIGNTAIKVPCRACSTSNITLSGEQTIDGVAVVTDDRVLVTAQTSSVDNGIYVADTGAWVRSTDMDGTYDIVTGTLVKVNSGTSNSGFWYVSTTGTPVIGTDAVDFGMASTALAVVSAFMQTVLDDTTAAAARTTLDAQEDVLTTIGDGIIATTAGAAARIAATANVAAHATTMNLWAARENILTGGAVTITDIADAPYAGAVTWVKMNAAHVWDDGAVFSVQGGADYTAAANDWVRIYATTVSTFEVTVFKKSGAPAVPARSRQVFTSGTAQTYTTPTGCIAINVRMVGGGGGGGAQATNAGAAGVASTWSGGSLSAGGGGGGAAASGAPGAGGVSANGDINIPGGAGAGGLAFGGSSNDTAPGGIGGSGAFGGGGTGEDAAAGGNGATNSGGGGAGGGISGNGNTGSGGGAGGYVEKLITSPAATYTYTVGTGGAGGAAGTLAGGNGAAGIVIVDEFYG